MFRNTPEALTPPHPLPKSISLKNTKSQQQHRALFPLQAPRGSTLTWDPTPSAHISGDIRHISKWCLS